MFRNYDVQGPADRVLVYLTLYIHLCLTKITGKSKGDAKNALYQLAISNFSIPGDSNFTLGGFVSNPANRGEAGKSDTFGRNQILLQRDSFILIRHVPRIRVIFSRFFRNCRFSISQYGVSFRSNPSVLYPASSGDWQPPCRSSVCL